MRCPFVLVLLLVLVLDSAVTGFVLYIPQGEFPAGQTARRKNPFHAPHFEHEDVHEHEHEDNRFRNSL
jgi:hypothetical protein